ncbi:MAG: TAXI family TRAP transporter solute-binding subunit [Alphaproteobacteria bacterium]|nr:TAXI family TRAP transporter solute-binding subunit [Alphaproteobacteria bacterium]
MKRKPRQLRGMLIVVAAVLVAVPLNAQVAPPEAQRISLQIATGPASGSYLRLGETIAKIVSHPPGLARCDVPGVCGPEGLIATLRSSSGSVANVIAVNSGRVRSAIVQGDVAAAAFRGAGPFKQTGPLTEMRAIARLHEETIHLVVASRSRIRKLADLVGKRVAIDGLRSATNHTARLLFDAAQVNPARIKLSLESPERAAEALRNGKLDAFFAIGVAPIPVVDGLVRRGQARVVGVDARAIAALSRANPMFGRYVLPGDSYRSSKAVATLNVATVWVVQKSLPDDVVHSILRSLWNPANRGDLRRLGKIAATIDASKAAENLPLPLHPGAERFYAEAGR